MTLNSVDYNTTLVIDWTSDEIPPVRPNDKIGKFIDALVEKYPERCELQQDGHTIYLPLPKGTAKALSVNEDGNMVWTELEAVTRHPPINKDGTNTLLKVKTESGREAIATKAKSFVVYENGKIIDKEGSDLKVGDLIPITNKTYPQDYRTSINVESILSPKEHLFTNNMIKAKEIMLEVNKTGKGTKWFYKIEDKVPYNRGDTLRLALEKAMIANGEEVVSGSNRANIGVEKAKLMFIPNMVYPKSWGKFAHIAVNGIPSTIELDRPFGFLIGAYLAEGCVTDFQVMIANNNENYRRMATEWTDKLNISNRLNGNKDEGISICIHSTIVRHLLAEICGIGSYNKRVPEFAYSAPDKFVEGLLDAYISGDGYVHTNGYVVAGSRSKNIRDGMTLLMTRFGIHTRLNEYMLLNKKDKNDPTGELKPMYELRTGVAECSKFIGIITAIDYKQNRIYENSDKLDKRRLRYFKDTVLDPVVSIEDYTPDGDFVYDLTVAGTRNMVATNCTNYRDSFHYAGCSAKNVTLGVPRLKELINVTKKLRTPSLTIYEAGNVKDITNDYGQKRVVEGIRSDLEYKTLQDIVRSSDIIMSDQKHKDDAVIDFYREIYNFDEIPIPDEFLSLRLSFSAKDLEYIDMSIVDIAKLLESEVAEPGIKVICSDDNDTNLFIRIIMCTDDPTFNNDTLRKIEIHCMGVKLKGCESIDRVYTKEVNVTKWDPERGHYKDKQWILETEGTNLLGSMEIEGIDHTRTVSNDIIEIFEVLGIEAARQALFNELRIVLSFDGSYVNYRHLNILVDTMTCRASITSITRHGINRNNDIGTLTKSSFEETVEILTDAAAFSELDPLKGISDNIMLGQMVPAGTGVFDLLHDMDMQPWVPSVKSSTGGVKCSYVPSEPDYGPLASYVEVFC